MPPPPPTGPPPKSSPLLVVLLQTTPPNSSNPSQWLAMPTSSQHPSVIKLSSQKKERKKENGLV
jgi:hypothetical protein